jgi:hypothetical protein
MLLDQILKRAIVSRSNALDSGYLSCVSSADIKFEDEHKQLWTCSEIVILADSAKFLGTQRYGNDKYELNIVGYERI